MPEAEPPGRKNDDSLVLRDAVKVLTEEVQLQKELMNLQNTQFQQCRQQLETLSEDLHRERQEAVLHRTVAAQQQGDLQRQSAELSRALGEVRQELSRAHETLGEVRQELSRAYEALGQARHELSQAQRQLNTRFWRYTRPLRGLLGLFDPKG